MEEVVLSAISEISESVTMGVWFLIAAALVFFMQAGFAMVETGFTRAKNAGNIIMKNLMDFCIGTIAFTFVGQGLLCSADSIGEFMGAPNLDLFTNFAGYNWSSFVFNLVFCATAATIVSGAMAERTKFSAYCLYSLMISLVVYPIEAFWVWGSNGWLINRGYVDFAGSSAIHMVGGVSALIGAAMLGPRIGKYVTGKDGKKTVKAIPGHSLTLGALGVFILWFGWYGFNGAAATTTGQMASIFGTTTIATAAATCATMLLTWIKNGKPDVSMTLNGSLAGLVAITAGCSNVDGFGALVIGIVAGILVVFAVEILDQKIKIDDPVGAVAVHGANGFWGTLAVGFFDTENGLFYGGGTGQLGIQALGVAAILVWTIVTMTIVFFLLNKIVGLRVTREEEIAGLDVGEHGLTSSYADFAQVLHAAPMEDITDVVPGSVPSSVAVPVEMVFSPAAASSGGPKMYKVVIVTRQNKFDPLKIALHEIGITGMTVSNVLGCGMQKGASEMYRGVPVEINLLPKIKVEIVVSKVPVRSVIETAKKTLYTGHIGDGKIFVYNVENVVKIRTGEEGYAALQYEDD
jgi:Amt family ammonium transporter